MYVEFSGLAMLQCADSQDRIGDSPGGRANKTYLPSC